MPLQAVRPKILGFISEQASAWLVALVVLLAGFTLTAIVAWAASDLYQQQVRQRFQLLVNERYSRLQERFVTFALGIDGGVQTGVRRFAMAVARLHLYRVIEKKALVLGRIDALQQPSLARTKGKTMFVGGFGLESAITS